MVNSLLTQVLVQTFEEKAGKWQVRAEAQKALKVSFRLTIDYNKEEGYRHLDLLIYGPANYVGVYLRERDQTIDLVDMEEDDEIEEMVPKVGKDYRNLTQPWKQVAYHDSGWTEGIDRVFREYNARITGFDSGTFYEVVTPPEEIQMVETIPRIL